MPSTLWTSTLKSEGFCRGQNIWKAQATMGETWISSTMGAHCLWSTDLHDDSNSPPPREQIQRPEATSQRDLMLASTMALILARR